MHRPLARAGGLLLAAAVAATLGAAPAAAVSGGSPAAPGTLPFAARITVGTERACTGALVEAQWLLTAASCFAEPGRTLTAGAPPRPATAVIGRDAASAGQTLPVAELRPRADRDLVLARLALRTTGITPVPVATTAPVPGEVLQVAGYGRTATEWVPDRLHTAPFTVAAVSATTLDITGTDPDRTSTCKGDAGGPALRGSGTGVQLVAVHSTSWQHGCLGVTVANRGSVEARADDLAEWVRTNTRGPGTAFTSSYAAKGIGGYNLLDARDQVVAFDYDRSGRPDHLLLYRPGTGVASVVKRTGTTYGPVFTSSSGLGTFDLRSAADRIVPFDFDGSGRLDHLLAYRPGSGVAYVLKRSGTGFSPVFASHAGIGTFDLKDADDRAVAFDYDGTGRPDDLMFYRPGSGIAYVLKRSGSTFTTAFSSHTGIGGFDLKSTADRIVAFDHDSTGRVDDLLVYRPGVGTAYVVRRGAGNTFTRTWAGEGIGGFSLRDARDQVTAYDYDQTGRLDHLVAYRPGVGPAWIVKRSGTSFARVFTSQEGIGGFDLMHAADRIVAFDDEGAGSPVQLVVYRPGGGYVFVIGRFRPAA